MKAVILNSELGKGMGDFTLHNHKSQAVLNNGETIYERQIRLLRECGIKDFVITVGPFKEQLMSIAVKPEFSDLSFVFVENPVYDRTGDIYTMYLASQYMDDDVILMHSDLVFNASLLQKMLDSDCANLAMVNRALPLPQKGLKARIKDDRITEISADIFDNDCFAFQPMYKLDKASVAVWIDRVKQHIAAGNDHVCAENALNKIVDDIEIKAFSYAEDYMDRIDNTEDLERVSNAVRQFDFDDQPIFSGKGAIRRIPDILSRNRVKKPMIVCGFYDKLIIRDYLDSLRYEFTVFSGYSPNPTYDQVLRGVELFRDAGCDFIISIGGGSAMDTAKNIKLFSVMDNDGDVPYIKRKYGFSPIKHLAIPATSGTGSESTRFSIVYYKGEKFSVTQDCILPDYVILCSELISTVSDFQKKCTMMDAISQCIEAIWNVKTNSLCRDYAVRGLRLALDNIDGYLAGDDESLHNMQLAANYSGKAINISQTTAGHAMSYKLSSLYGIPHGYAVALCLIEVWRYMADSKESDNNEVLSTAFEIINNVMQVDSPYLAIAFYEHILFDVLGLEKIALRDEKDIDELTKAVNIARLANNPVALDVDAVKFIYKKIFA